MNGGLIKQSRVLLIGSAALIWSNASFIFRKRWWRHPAPSNGCVSTATSSDVPSLLLSQWLSSVVTETEKNHRFTRMNWWVWRMLCCHGWRGSAHRSGSLCLATWALKVGVDAGQLGHEDPSPPLRHHQQLSVIVHQTAVTCAACSPVLFSLIWSVFICTSRFSSSGACSWMDPAVLIFLLYMMIAHELVCGWMQYRRQSAKPRKRAAGPLLRSRWVCACVRVLVWVSVFRCGFNQSTPFACLFWWIWRHC